jgi:hypothetical protein
MMRLPSFVRWSLPGAAFVLLVFAACNVEEPDYCTTHPYDLVCGGGCVEGGCARPGCQSNADCPLSTPICVLTTGQCEARTSIDASATADATVNDASVESGDDDAALEAATDTSDAGDADLDAGDGDT